MTQAGEAVYVYGVVAGTSKPAAEGVDSAPVRTLRHAEIAALVSTVSRTELRAADVRAHWRVLEHAFEHATVLPMRFGTIMESDGEVRERLLEPNADRLAELIAAMDGLIQLNVKGRYDEKALLQAVLRAAPALARLRERADRSGALADQVELGQQVEQEIERRRAQDTAMARHLLEGVAVEVREDLVRHPDAFNLAFLVARDAMDAFGAGVGRVRDELGGEIEIRYTGPAPPFSFAEGRLEMVDREWA